MIGPVDPDAPSASGAPGLLALVGVAVGGATGTISRYGITRILPAAGGSVPWSIFLVNVSGSFALGFVLHLVIERWPTNDYIRPFVAIGFIGGFTTFSTVMVDTDLLVRDGHAGTGAAFVIGSVIAGLLAAFAGIAIASRVRRTESSC